MIILENLPLDCQLSILNYLDINSLLRLRLLNKKFNRIVQNVRINSLSVMNSAFIIQKYKCELGLELELEDVERFFYTNELINQSTNLLLSNSNRLFKSNFMKIILSRIKKLYIKEAPVNNDQEFDLDKNLNQFNSLEQLQISKIKLDKSSILNLKNLKILYIRKIITNYHLILETPSLFALKCESIEFYSFNYPEKIKYLFSIEIPDDKKFNELKNLKSIFFYNNQFYNYIYPDFTLLANLEEVHLNSLLEKSIRTLFEKKIDKNAKFKIFLNGINLNQIEDINQYYDELGRLKSFQINKFIELNYTKTYHFIPNIFELNYNYLIKLNVISDNFNRKFPNLYKIIVDQNNEKIDQLIFINFITSIKTLRLLDINALFDQNFYDNLHIYCPYLASLAIQIDGGNYINLDFLSKNTSIQIFIINQTIPLKLLKNFLYSLKQLYKLTYFSIKLKNIIIYVKIKVRNCSPNHTIELTFDSPYSNRSYFKNLNCMSNFMINLIK